MKNKRKVIADAICGVLILVSVFVYIVLGLAIGWWHPGWIIIVGSLIISGIISIIVNANVNLNQEEKPEEKPKKFKDL